MENRRPTTDEPQQTTNSGRLTKHREPTTYRQPTNHRQPTTYSGQPTTHRQLTDNRWSKDKLQQTTNSGQPTAHKQLTNYRQPTNNNGQQTTYTAEEPWTTLNIQPIVDDPQITDQLQTTNNPQTTNDHPKTDKQTTNEPQPNQEKNLTTDSTALALNTCPQWTLQLHLNADLLAFLLALLPECCFQRTTNPLASLPQRLRSICSPPSAFFISLHGPPRHWVVIFTIYKNRGGFLFHNLL